ncbi:TetR family transcriptional regulator [Barrientosiimonas humi]|uniref:TetR family transcriptional regulator n=2 Tax=Barrientosiimonas TaxID=1535207 RepID=A0A542X9K3_9MICO|nr:MULTISPECIES: TetR family transcriptional regulator C-terminal domain-containing protein [Barrientosiimonas]TQL32508.1 TetR family transcriptional regulator [Barrientosiimonas humi]BDZ57276.1 TetR family transcriptional regulator [Barrientosiimonas endolithica]CAG7572500.1 HTH-type transcriptional repressor ComR [Barrientosiimonas humi]
MARHKEFDEQRALDHALETFWSGTYAATSTQDLCTSTGLSRSSLYNTFTCKSDLYRRALERYDELRAAERGDYLDRAGTGREVLAALLGDVLHAQCDSPERRSCMAINAAVELGDSDPEIAALSRASFDSFRAVVAALIARGQDDGSISATTPAAELAAVVHATLSGLQISARVSSDPAAHTKALHTLLSLL